MCYGSSTASQQCLMMTVRTPLMLILGKTDGRRLSCQSMQHVRWLACRRSHVAQGLVIV